MTFSSIDVLDYGFVEIQNHLGEDLDVVTAARVSYLSDSKGYDRDVHLMDFLASEGHYTPFEHNVIRFRVKAPGAVFNQWVRHRIGSFSVQSRRFMLVSEDDHYYIPEHFRSQDKVNKQGSKENLPDDINEKCKSLLQSAIEFNQLIYNQMIEYGVAKEQARLVLPFYSLYTTFVWTVNLRSLFNFMNLRTDSHAQQEIQEYGNAVETLVQELWPVCYGVYLKHYKGKIHG